MASLKGILTITPGVRKWRIWSGSANFPHSGCLATVKTAAASRAEGIISLPFFWEKAVWCEETWVHLCLPGYPVDSQPLAQSSNRWFPCERRSCSTLSYTRSAAMGFLVVSMLFPCRVLHLFSWKSQRLNMKMSLHRKIENNRLKGRSDKTRLNVILLK